MQVMSFAEKPLSEANSAYATFLCYTAPELYRAQGQYAEVSDSVRHGATCGRGTQGEGFGGVSSGGGEQRQLRGVLGNNLVDSEDPEYRQIPFSVTGRIDKPKTDLLDKLIGAKVGHDVGGMLG